MPSPKQLRNESPRISLSSWISGGPIVTKPRHSRPRPVLVTTKPAKAPKAAKAVEPNDAKVENDNGKTEPKVPEEAPKNTEDAKSDAAAEVSNAEKSDNEPTWTPEQDALILKLKGENTSWKAIATQMSLAKSDIQARFKELQKKGAETPAASTADSKSKGKGKGKDGENGNEKETEVTQSTDKGGDEEEAAEIQNADKGGDKEEAAEIQNADKGGDEKEAEVTQDADKGGHEDGGHESGGHEDSCQHKGRLKPDHIWSRQDCALLEMLETRYREHKWLYLQANFYNLTGRMISAEIIEWKFSEAAL